MISQGKNKALFNLTIDGRGLTMNANIDPAKKIKMQTEINGCLNATDVRII